MQILTRQSCTTLAFLSLLSINSFAFQERNSEPHSFDLAMQLKFENPDSSVQLFEKALHEYSKSSDTVNIVNVLVELADLLAHNGNFSHAYDNYWKALLFADEYGQESLKSKVYRGLGYMYILYNRLEETKYYLNLAIGIDKKIIAEEQAGEQTLLDDYYAFLSFYRRRGETRLARLYADSCSAILNQADDYENNMAFLNAELGYIEFEDGNFEQALRILLPLESYFEKNRHSYIVFYHYYLGKIYQALNNIPKSKYYFESAIKAWKRHKSHSDITPDIYYAYADLLHDNKMYKEAYKYLKTGQELNDQRFGSRSINNQQFIEIKDKFRIQQAEKAKFEQEQKLHNLEQEKKISRLEVRILFVTVGLLIVIVFITYRFFRIRYKADKKLMLERRKMERIKSKELLEIKNKELTASALQVIQKKEALTDLKEELLKLETDLDPRKIKRLAKSINTGTSNNWKEFEARFVSVNKKFYSKLHKSFPELSQGDQKICALIKLNFTSKDMAKLLGISVESVHTTRYRLRKKLGLQRSDNLEEFIANIG